MRIDARKLLAVGFVTLLSLAWARMALADEPLQLLRNGGFEEDEMTLRAEPASSCGGETNDQWYNMQDRFPDGWQWLGKYVPNSRGNARIDRWPLDGVAIDTAIKRSGKSSIRLSGKDVTLFQNFEWNRLTDLYHEKARRGPDLAHTSRLPQVPGLFQEMTLSGWVRVEGLPDDASVTATLMMSGRGTVVTRIPLGETGWRKFTVTLAADPAKQAAEAVPAAPPKKRAAKGKGAAAKRRAGGNARARGPGESVEIQLALEGGAEGKGNVWFDDLTLTAPARFEPNLLPNSSFESVIPAGQAHQAIGPGTQAQGAIAPGARDDYPAGWSQPRKWHYLPPPVYYIWNNWQHFYSPTRRAPVSDSLVVHTGKRSLRFDLLPGDEYLIESQPIKLNQSELRPIEVTAWVRADRLRHFDIMLVDQDGNRLPTNDIIPFWGGLLAGTHDWIAVRKIFLGHGPLQNVRLRLAGRGFNGQTETDIGVHHAYNQVSTVWIDDVAVREIGTTAEELSNRTFVPPAEPLPVGLRIVNLDLGERLFGENFVWAELRNELPRHISVRMHVDTLPASERQYPYPEKRPDRAELDSRSSMSKVVTFAPGEVIKVSVPYRIKELSRSIRDIHAITVSLWEITGGLIPKPNAQTFWFSTWPVVANVRPSKAYLDQSENPMLVSMNLGATQSALASLEKLNVQVIDRQTGQATVSQEVKDISQAIAATKIPGAADEKFYYQVPRAGLLDFRNLILLPLDISTLSLRPWDDPEADWVVRVTGVAKDGSKLFTSDSHPFGRLTRINEELPPVKEVTVDPQGHFLRVNGKPFFIFAQSHGNGISLGGAPATRKVPPWTRNEHAMNSINRWAGINDLEKMYDQKHLYGPMLMATRPKASSFETMRSDFEANKISVYTAGNHAKSKIVTVDELNGQTAALGLFVLMSEGIVADSPDLRAAGDFASRLSKSKKIKRPIGAMDNHSQFYPWNAEPGGFLDGVDLLFMEREEGNLFRPELSARDWMKRNPNWMICDLPQTYENVPHERERYQALKNTLHGSRGWFGIQGCADPSLYRGLGGELRHIFTYLSANDGMPNVNAPEGVVAKAWKKGDKVLVIAEQHNPVTRGVWDWHMLDYTKLAHTGASRHLVTPVKEGFAVHGYNDDIYREIAAGDTLEQTVSVISKRRPKAIFLMIPGNNDFNHVAYWGDFNHEEFRSKKVDAFLSGECYSMASYGINWTRSKEEEFLKFQAEHRFPAKAFVRMGDLPAPGEVVTLKVALDKLGLTGKVVDGLMFMTSGNGDAWWGSSTLVRAGGQRETLLDGRIGRDPEQFAKAVVKVEGLGEGTVRVIGESRNLQMVNGSWTDDLKGRDLYGFFGDGWLGDGINYGQPVDRVPENLELSYTYDDSPRCIRVYEITPRKN